MVLNMVSEQRTDCRALFQALHRLRRMHPLSCRTIGVSFYARSL